MYKEFFEFKTLPFENTPDPDFFFMGAGYRDTLALMKHSVMTRKGVLCIAGPIGCGKTTLANTLIENLPENAIVIPVSTPRASSKDLVSYIAGRLDVGEIPDSFLECHDLIRDKLVRINDEDRYCVMIIDESHLMSEALFQEVLFLANLETRNYKLLQIILLGQMELLQQLNNPKRLQLAQRISVTQVIKPMDEEQSEKYIKHRISVSKGREDVIAPDALNTIINLSGGIPRLINKLSDGALLRAFIEQKKTVEEEDVQKANNEIGIDEFPVKSRFYYSRTKKRTDQQYFIPVLPEKPQPQQTEEVSVEKKPESIPATHKNEVIQKAEDVITRVLGSEWLKFTLVFLVIIFLLSGILKNCRNSDPAVSVHENKEIPEIQASPAYDSGKPTGHQVMKDDDSSENVTAIEQEMEIEASQQVILEQSEKTIIEQKPEADNLGRFEYIKPSQGNQPVIEKRKPVQEKPVLKPKFQKRKLSVSADSFPYAILLASYRSKVDADRALKIFSEMGFSAYWSRVDLAEQGEWFRVFSGHYEHPSQADEVIRSKELSGAVVKNTQYAALVGTYSTQEWINTKGEALIDSGFSYYSIKRKGGMYYLYVGAFYTIAGAEIQCTELEAMGINCQVTER